MPVVLIGMAPWLVEPVVDVAARAVIGGTLPDYHLALWHGVTPAVFMTAVALAGGLLLLASLPAGRRRAAGAAAAGGQGDLRPVIAGAVAAAARASPTPSTTARCSVACCWRSWSCSPWASRPSWAAARAGAGHLPFTLPAVVLWLLVLAASAAVIGWHRHRLLALVLTSIVGLVVP